MCIDKSVARARMGNEQMSEFENWGICKFENWVLAFVCQNTAPVAVLVETLCMVDFLRNIVALFFGKNIPHTV